MKTRHGKTNSVNSDQTGSMKVIAMMKLINIIILSHYFHILFSCEESSNSYFQRLLSIKHNFPNEDLSCTEEYVYLMTETVCYAAFFITPFLLAATLRSASTLILVVFPD